MLLLHNFDFLFEKLLDLSTPHLFLNEPDNLGLLIMKLLIDYK